MIYILISICCSVFVSVLLKLARRYQIDTRQAIAWNYSIAGALTWVFYKPDLPPMDGGLFPVYVALGILLPSLFVVLALSVRYTGIVRTDVAQRLSLFIPVLAAFFLFNEDHSPLKITGIIIAFVAIIFSIPWQKKESKSSSYWIYPVIVFIGMGVIDVLFKQIARTAAIPFTSSLFFVFILAFCISIVFLGYLFVTGRSKFSLVNLVCEWDPGIANFGNILFYLKAHQALSDSPSIVFSTMNIGVIVLGSLVGVFIFHEKLSRLNYAGIALAIVSIFLISRA